jgi:uncharacterized membrane protein
MDETRSIRAAAALLVAIGIGLRTWNLTTAPMWLDEAYSAYAAAHGFGFLWRVVPLYETHPPFYYSLLRMWVLVFGDSLTALRLFGWIAGLLTLPTMVLAANAAARWMGWTETRRRALALAAIGLSALSLVMVRMTHEIRPYPLMILLYTAALTLILHLARRSEARTPISGGCLAVYLIALECLLWLHNLGPLFGLALTIALAIAVLRPGLPRREWGWLIAGHALVALLYLPGLGMLRGQVATWTMKTWLQFKLDMTLLDRIQTLYGVAGWVGLASLLLAILAVRALVTSDRGIRLAAILLVLALLPVMLAILISLAITPVFVTRILTPTAAPALLLLAIGATAPGRYRPAGVAAGMLLGASMLAGDVQAGRGRPMQDWYGTVDWLAMRFRPGDQVFAYPNEGKLPLHYALRDRGLDFPIRAIPTDVPALEARNGRHPAGTRGASSLPPAELHAIANEPATRTVPTIWLLRLAAETYDPGDLFLRELHHGRYIVRSWRAGPIDITGLRMRPKAHAAPPPLKPPRAPVRNRR